MLKKTDLIDIFLMGRKTRYLKDCEYHTRRVKGEAFIIGNLEILKTRFEELNDKRTAKQIDRFISYLRRKYKKEDGIKDSDGEDLGEKIKIWEDRALNLLSEKISIEVSLSTILNYSQLLEGSKGFFEDSQLRKIPYIARKDLDDCCYCLLIGLSTPSALMALRVIEECLKGYYKRKTKKNPKKLEWGPLTDGIKKLPNYDKDLITHLDNLRKNLRNKAMHPERRFDQREMEEIFVTVLRTVEDLIK